jgi:hypothetical protein
MILLAIICLTGLTALLCLLMEIRNRVVFAARMMAHKIVFAKDGDWQARCKLYDAAPSYGRMMFQITKWKMKHFFPELAVLQ